MRLTPDSLKVLIAQVTKTSKGLFFYFGSASFQVL